MTNNDRKQQKPDEAYDPGKDPDADPEMLSSHRRPQQPDQAEGDDDAGETEE